SSHSRNRFSTQADRQITPIASILPGLFTCHAFSRAIAFLITLRPPRRPARAAPPASPLRSMRAATDASDDVAGHQSAPTAPFARQSPVGFLAARVAPLPYATGMPSLDDGATPTA